MFNSHKNLNHSKIFKKKHRSSKNSWKIDTKFTLVQWSLFSEERSLLRQTVRSFSGNRLAAKLLPGKSQERAIIY